MNQPYQIVLDTWEGNIALDDAFLIAEGVAGRIVRLNDMSGGHHLDKDFSQGWIEAKQYKVQALYFVYNPWRTGAENAAWLFANLPTDYGKRRILADVEVKYDGITTAEYARQVNIFIALVSARNPLAIYTGLWFLPYLSAWPANVDYWWAAYPYAYNSVTTWDGWRTVTNAIDLSAFQTHCPGKVMLHQTTGDYMAPLPGFGGHKVDTNVFQGTVEQLAAWFNVKLEDTEEPPMANKYTGNAIGFYTDSATGPEWDNPAFDFVIGYAGGDWTQEGPNNWVLEPNDDLKLIEEKAHKQGMPILALWDFDVSAYSMNQIKATEETWPDEAGDYPLQALIGALKNRDIDGLVIRMMNNTNRVKGVEMMNYIAFAAQKFIERANRWLYTTKGLDKYTFVLTSDPFMRTKDKDGTSKEEYFYRWIKNQYIGIEQQAASPLASGAWPNDNDSIKAIPDSLGCKFWYHYNTTALDMFMWISTPEQMYSFIGYKPGGDPGGDDTPEPDYAALAAKVDALAAEVELVKAWAKDIGYKGAQ